MRMNEKLYCEVKVNNMPASHGHGFMVARLNNGELWYYGIYPTDTMAKKVAIEIKNGVVLSI